MRVSSDKIFLSLFYAIHLTITLEHGHASLEDESTTLHDVPLLKLKKTTKIVHHANNYKDEWIPGHVEHHSFIPGHFHHVLIPTHEVLLTHHSSPHPNVFKSHVGGFGIGLDSGGHGSGHGYHVWTAYGLR